MIVSFSFLRSIKGQTFSVDHVKSIMQSRTWLFLLLRLVVRKLLPFYMKYWRSLLTCTVMCSSTVQGALYSQASLCLVSSLCLRSLHLAFPGRRMLPAPWTSALSAQRERRELVDLIVGQPWLSWLRYELALAGHSLCSWHPRVLSLIASITTSVELSNVESALMPQL